MAHRSLRACHSWLIIDPVQDELSDARPLWWLAARARRVVAMRHRLFAAALTLAMTAGCVSVVEYPAPALPPPAEAPALYRPPVMQAYRLQVGDSLAIRSYFDSQLNQDSMVRPDGRISALLLGDLQASGLTPDALAVQLRERYRRLIGDTDVTVTLVRGAGMNVFLSGEVRTPALLPMDGELTLLQAVSRSGGTLSSAHVNSVLLIRSGEDGQLSVRKIDLEKILRGEMPDVYLVARDVVHVPKSSIAQTGQFVEQYINAIVPRAVQLQFGWMASRITNTNPEVQVRAP